MTNLRLLLLPGDFSVFKLSQMPDTQTLSRPHCFFARTEEEISLVCPADFAPAGIRAREDGFRLFRVRGALDFSLVGILSRVSGALANAGVGLFAISTYDTDYILVRAENLARAARALRAAGYALDGEWEG